MRYRIAHRVDAEGAHFYRAEKLGLLWGWGWIYSDFLCPPSPAWHETPDAAEK